MSWQAVSGQLVAAPLPIHHCPTVAASLAQVYLSSLFTAKARGYGSADRAGAERRASRARRQHLHGPLPRDQGTLLVPDARGCREGRVADGRCDRGPHRRATGAAEHRQYSGELPARRRSTGAPRAAALGIAASLPHALLAAGAPAAPGQDLTPTSGRRFSSGGGGIPRPRERVKEYVVLPGSRSSSRRHSHLHPTFLVGHVIESA